MSCSAAKAGTVSYAPPRVKPRRFPAGGLHRASPWDYRRFAACLATAIFWFAVWSSSAGAEVLIEPRVGFHGVFQLGRPFPLEIILSNSGRPIEGNLEVQVWKGGVAKGGAPFAVKYRREVFLPAQARKTVQLTVDPDFISRPLVIVFLSAAGRTARELDLRRYFAPAPILLLLSENNILLPIAALSGAPQNRLVSIAPAELTADPRALLGVSHLILYDQSLRELSRTQFNALETWLTAGGRLIIIGSLNYALYQEPSISRFLPVRVTGTKQISFVPNPDKQGKGASLSGVWAQESKLLKGRTILESAGMPIVVAANRGRGRIIYLALDIGRPPLSQWDGLTKFTQRLFEPGELDSIGPRTEWNDAVFAQLVASPKFISTYVPSGSLLLAMLLYLSAVGTGAWLRQAKRIAPRALLAGLFGLVVVATLAGYAHFNRGGNIPDGVLLSASILEDGGDGYVEAQANLALFSTQSRRYELGFERGWLDLIPVSGRQGEGQEPAVVYQEGGGSIRYQLPLREWDYRLFRMQSVERFPVRAEFEPQGEKLIMRIFNHSDKDLTHCWLIVPGQRFDLGQIGRGASWQKSFPLKVLKGQVEAAAPRVENVSFREVTFADKTRDILFHTAFFPRGGDAPWASGAAVFIGWVQEPGSRVHIDDPRIQTQDYALFRAIFPLALGDDE